MAVNERLQDLNITHQQNVELFKTNLASRGERIYRRGIRELRTKLRSYTEDRESNLIPTPTVRNEIEKALLAILNKINREYENSLNSDIQDFTESEQRFYERSLRMVLNSFEVQLPIQIPDEGVAFNRTKSDPMYLRNGQRARYLEELRNPGLKARRYIRDNLASGFTLGLSIFIISSNLFSSTTGLFRSILRSSRITASLLSQHATSTSRAVFYEQNRDIIKGYKWVSVLDSRTSDTCQYLSERTWFYDNPEASTLPGPISPPAHYNCFDDETEVYTNFGWKHFSEINGFEKFLSFNPKNISENTFVDSINYFKREYKGKMLFFNNKNNDFNLCVTPDHNLVLKYRGKKSNGNYRFVKASKIPKWQNQFYRGLTWKGKNRSLLKLGEYKLTPQQYCVFMGYYLSNGILTEIDNNSHRIEILNQKKIKGFYNNLKDLPFKINKNKYSINIYSQTIVNELKRFGKSHEKFVPDTIKNMTKKNIIIFLNSFITAQSYNHKLCKEIKDSKVLYTKSKKLADDLGELILKAGGRPSYSLEKENTWLVFWRHHIHSNSESIIKSEIDYSGNVYCVELRKWHTLLVRRNGCVVWAGNCRSTTSPIVKSRRDLSDNIINAQTIGLSALAVALTGAVPARTSYRQWLERQPASIQREVLGEARYNLYRSGELTIDRFYSDDARFYTLRELDNLGVQIPEEYLRFINGET